MAQENQKPGSNVPHVLSKAVGDFVHGTRKADNAAAEAVIALVTAVKDAPVPEGVVIDVDSDGKELTFGDLSKWTRRELKRQQEDGSSVEDTARITAIKMTLLASSTHGAAMLKELSKAEDDIKSSGRDIIAKSLAADRKALLVKERNAAAKMIERAAFISVAYMAGCGFGQKDGDGEREPDDIRANSGTLELHYTWKDSKGNEVSKWIGTGIGKAEGAARTFLRPDTANKATGARQPGNTPAPTGGQRDVVQFSPEAFAHIVSDENQTKAALDAVRGLIARLDAKDTVAKHKDALRDLIDDVIELAVEAGLAARVRSELADADKRRKSGGSNGNGKGKDKPEDKANAPEDKASA